MGRPEPVFIGFFPKHTEPGSHPDLGAPGVEEICSASACISKGPKGWIDRWLHNAETWLYDTEETAAQMVSSESIRYDFYAYRIFPVRFDGCAQSSLWMPTVAGQIPCDYEFLGYDVVEEMVPDEPLVGGTSNCSPLSCNGGCRVFRVNRYCLLDGLDYAWETCARIACEAKERGIWEPGPYCLVEVHRKRRRPIGAPPL